MDLIFTLLTIAACIAVLVLTATHLAFIHDSARDYGAPATRLVLGYVLLGTALALFAQVGALRLVAALNGGSTWSNPYVLHIPGWSDFWRDYLPGHLTARTDAGVTGAATVRTIDIWAGLTLLAGIGMIAWGRFSETGRSYAERYSFAPIFRNAIRDVLGVFVSVQILLFLAAYALASVMYLGSFWKFLLGFLVLGLMGGTGKKLYDENGKHVATMKD